MVESDSGSPLPTLGVMPRIKALQPSEAKRTLVNRFGPRVDRLRQLATKFGLRPYRVFMVWSRFSGGEEGAGEKVILRREEIVPTPKVEGLDSTRFVMSHPGVIPEGTARLSQISIQYTSDHLRGLWIPEQHEDRIEPGYAFEYEIVEDGRGDSQPVRCLYRLSSQPERQAGKVGWVLTLERVSGDLERNGTSSYG